MGITAEFTGGYTGALIAMPDVLTAAPTTMVLLRTITALALTTMVLLLTMGGDTGGEISR